MLGSKNLGRALGRSRLGRQVLALGLAVAIQCVSRPVARAEDQLDYKYEAYMEEKGRIHIHTHAAYFEKEFDSRFSLKGQVVFDAITGASPSGQAVLPGESAVRVVELVPDDRRAGFLQPEMRLGRHTFAPQFSYSDEHDYTSTGVAYTHTIAFNEKNTLLSLGVSHTFDQIHPVYFGPTVQHKNSTDFLLGLSQVLTKSTVFTANLTMGTSSGYLNDPYKGFTFQGLTNTYVSLGIPNDLIPLLPEARPTHKVREVLHLALNQFVEPMNAGLETTYRLSHDSFGIFSHTAEVYWHQNLSRYVVISPMFRFYQQNAAHFYHESLPGDPTDPSSWPGVDYPEFFSSDYRLSSMRTLTYGAMVTFRPQKWMHVDLAYKRYEMRGLDGVTSQSAYPMANVWTVGMRFVF